MSGRLPDLYAILQVDRTATQAEIRSAYRRLLRALHPDLQSGPGAEEAARRRQQLQAVMEAYEVLGDPERRTEYDQAAAAQQDEPWYGDPLEPFLRGWPPRQD